MTARPGRQFERERPVLTARQVEVLAGAAMGEQSKQTAQRLFLSLEGVKSHHRDIRKRLGARNVTHAVHLAHGLGLL